MKAMFFTLLAGLVLLSAGVDKATAAPAASSPTMLSSKTFSHYITSLSEKKKRKRTYDRRHRQSRRRRY